ncbi:MAG: hypothetical protein OXC72_04900 [Roseovarius sp.]|nr:hypothetical protein [Roseovarius sp.]
MNINLSFAPLAGDEGGLLLPNHGSGECADSQPAIAAVGNEFFQ